MGSGHHSQSVSGFRRLLAVGCAALVFALCLFGASPILHAQLHHHDGDCPASDDGCAVVLFASGVSVPLAAIAAPLPPAEWSERNYFASAEICLDSPRYLLQPGRGPPVLG